MKLILTFLVCVFLQLSFEAVVKNRIYNGEPVWSNWVPYLARIVVYLEDGTHFICTGSLISHYYVLTAAQCVPPGTVVVKVALGIDDTDDLKGLELDCTDWTTFNEDGSYSTNIDGKDYINDIALIRLPVCVEFTEFIFAVDVPSLADRFLDVTNATGKITGWGQTELDATPVVPSSAWVTVLDKRTCLDLFKKSNMKYDAENQFCTSHLKEGACRGDNGGPLVISRYGKLIQYGIILSATFIDPKTGLEHDQCATNFADSYTKLTNYLDFINDNTDINIGWCQNTFYETYTEAAEGANENAAVELEQ